MAKEKRRGTSDGMMVSSKPSADRPKPSFEVDENDLPEVKDWSVGKKYHVKAHVEMQSHSKGDSWLDEGGKKKHRARLVIHKIEAAESKNGDDD